MVVKGAFSVKKATFYRYSKWSCAFLDLRSSEYTCARNNILALFQESFNATTIFLQLRHFLLDVFQEVCVGPIKAELRNMASTYCCDLLSQLN